MSRRNRPLSGKVSLAVGPYYGSYPGGVSARSGGCVGGKDFPCLGAEGGGFAAILPFHLPAEGGNTGGEYKWGCFVNFIADICKIVHKTGINDICPVGAAAVIVLAVFYVLPDNFISFPVSARLYKAV